MRREDLDTDLDDDEQEDAVRAYARYIEDPPSDLRIRNRENYDEHRAPTARELDEETRRHEPPFVEDRPAEAAAIRVIDDTATDPAYLDGD